MSEHLITVTDSPHFYDLLEIYGHRLVIINYFAEWCPPSRSLSSTLKQISEHYDGKIIILDVDIDECDDLATINQIDVIPLFAIMKSGFKVDTVLGNQSKSKIEQTIKQYLL